VADRIRGIVVIPQDFGRRVAAGRGGEIQVITDGSLPNTASFVAAYAEGVRAAWAAGYGFEQGQRRAPPIVLASRFWFNPELASRYFLVPGSIAIVMTMIGTLLTALVVAREWERGTMEAVMATPLGMGELLATKVLPYFALGLGSMTLCTLIGTFVFDVPFRGSPLALLLISSAFLVPALGQGLLISAALKNQFMASQVALLTAFLPSMLLSGFIFEIESMPRWIQLITYAVPARYLIPSLQTVFIAGDLWGLFLPNMAVMLGFGALFFALAMRATRRRIA
jgi:ABC-2 type transport system permease protein